MISRRHLAARSVRALAAAALAVGAFAPAAPAQRMAAPAGVSTVAAPSALAHASRAEMRVADGRAGRVLDYAVNGALIGLAVSAIVAIVAAETADVQEGVPPVVLVPVGTVAGAVVGTVVGLVRTQ